MASNNVLRRRGRPTQTSYLDAVQEIVGRIDKGLTDQELAERIDCSAGTISNARNKKGKLCAVTLANIGFEFGPEALLPFMSLFDCIAIPRQSQAANDLETISALAHVAGEWVTRLSDGTRCPKDTAALAERLRPLLVALTAVVKEAESQPEVKAA